MDLADCKEVIPDGEDIPDDIEEHDQQFDGEDELDEAEETHAGGAGASIMPTMVKK